MLSGSLTLVSADENQPSPAVTGFFHVEQIEGRWELIDPEGKFFFSTGVASIKYPEDVVQNNLYRSYRRVVAQKYGNLDAYHMATAQRLLSWNFNTVGAWSDYNIVGAEVGGRHMAYTPILNLASGFAADQPHSAQAWLHGVFPDVFSPDFMKYCQEQAEKLAAFKNDPYLLGYFTDNELCWGPDWRGTDELLIIFLNLSRNAPGRKAALALLRERHPDISKFNGIYGTAFSSWDQANDAKKFVAPKGADRKAASIPAGEGNDAAANSVARAYIDDCNAFLGILADKYFQITRNTIRAMDPHHMILGCRFAYMPPRSVMDAADKCLDVISFNYYGVDPTDGLGAYALEHKLPLFISEFLPSVPQTAVCRTKRAAKPQSWKHRMTGRQPLNTLMCSRHSVIRI